MTRCTRTLFLVCLALFAAFQLAVAPPALAQDEPGEDAPIEEAVLAALHVEEQLARYDAQMTFLTGSDFREN